MARYKKKCVLRNTRYNTHDRWTWHAHSVVVGWQVFSNVQRTLAVGILARRSWECPVVSGFWNLPATLRRQRRWTTNSRSTRWVSRSPLINDEVCFLGDVYCKTCSSFTVSRFEIETCLHQGQGRGPGNNKCDSAKWRK